MKDKTKVIFNLPNILTMIRMGLIPVFWAFMLHGHSMMGLFTFFIASMTDLADGYIARKYHLITDFGKLFDPIADKLTVVSVFLIFLIKGVFPLVPFIIIVIKECIMLIGGTFLLVKGVVAYSAKAGKIAQFMMSLSMGLAFFADYFNGIGFPIHLILLWFSVACTLYALYFYWLFFLHHYHIIKQKDV